MRAIENAMQIAEDTVAQFDPGDHSAAADSAREILEIMRTGNLKMKAIELESVNEDIQLLEKRLAELKHRRDQLT